jgi:hypothetical protein
MATRIFAIGSLVVVGVIIADIIIHPTGTAAASAGAVSVEKPALNALLGQTS